jgi:hypothetical protein
LPELRASTSTDLEELRQIWNEWAEEQEKTKRRGGWKN